MGAFLILLALAGFWVRGRMRGPHHDFTLDTLAPQSAVTPGVLHAGVAVRDISPPEALWDPWIDVDGDQQFDPDVDTWTDRNGNGEFDTVYLAGFERFRPASEQRHPLDVRALALRNNGQTVVLVTADIIGMEHNTVMRLRGMIDPGLGVDHLVISATHTHEVPDPIGMWSGPIPFLSFDPAYAEFMYPRFVEAIEEAVAALQPVDMYCVTVRVPDEGYVRDSRKPHVWDKNLYAWRFTPRGEQATLATFVNWGNHPEALGGTNTVITPDFPYYLRKGLEEGVPAPNGVEGFGGVCLYFQGILGGLMTPLELEVPHRDGEHTFVDDTFEKAQALGENVAILTAIALRGDAVWKNEQPLVAWAARTVRARVQPLIRLAIALGITHRGYYPGGYAQSEVSVVRVGGVMMLVTPGEIFPELIVGGLEAKPGRDFDIEPVEVPPLYEVMGGRMTLTIGVANDFIGYIMPKTQWDNRAPYIYDNAPQYGEMTSSGPELGPAIHGALLELVEDLQAAHPWPGQAR